MIWARGLTIGLFVGILPAFAGAQTPVAEGPPPIDVGHVVVTERSRQSLSVFVDGVECGTTPWEGNLEAGSHEVTASSARFAAPPQTVRVDRGATVAVELVAQPLAARVDVTTGDPQAMIFLDGRLAAWGSFHGAAPIGPHTVRVARVGFDASEASFVLSAGQPWSEVVHLVPSAAPEPPPERPHDDSGAYGGVLLHLLFEPGGAGTDICAQPEVTGCSVSDPMGGGLFAYAGYMIRPIGFDALVGFQVDASQAHATVQTTSDSVAVPRVGGLFAVRARWALSSRVVRFSVGAGVGGAARAIGNIGGSDESASYFAPAITADVALAVPITPSVAFSLGLFFWGENAGNDATVAASPLTSPIHVVASTQTFFLPFLGLEFGP